MLRGLLLQESLADLSVLDALRITNTEVWDVRNAAPGQPATWTAMWFEVDDAEADTVAARLSEALKPEGWYIDARAGDTVYVIFPQRVFVYGAGDAGSRAAAQAHGRTLGIPEAQLDWGE